MKEKFKFIYEKSFFLFLCFTTAVFAQQTNRFTISGKVKNEWVITMDSLNNYPLVTIGDMKVTDVSAAE